MSVISGVRINRFDIAGMAGLGRYGLLSTEEAFLFYSEYRPNSVQKRLRLLSQNRLTRMTKLAVWFADEKHSTKGGRIPTLHALTEEGARFIEDETGDRPERVLRSDPSAMTFLHRKQIVRVMRSMDLACDAVELQRPDWVMEQDVWSNCSPQLPPNQRRKLYHDLGNGLICQPDLACRLTINQTELTLFWEIDLSTEGRKQIRRASKTASYVALFNQQGWQRYWPELETKRLYVVWVAPTVKRIRSLQEALRDQSVAPVCRFLEATNLDDVETLLTAPIWETISGDRRPMYRPPADTPLS